jgi:hypothetical protein
MHRLYNLYQSISRILFSRAECAGTRRSASKGHHWFLSSIPVLRGPGRLKSDSRRVFGFPQKSEILCFTYKHRFYHINIHIRVFTQDQFTSSPTRGVSLTPHCSRNHCLLFPLSPQIPLNIRVFTKTLSGQYLWKEQHD